MKTIKNRFLFNLYYFLFWIVYFAFARLFFLLYYFEKTQTLQKLTVFKTFLHGLKLDISFAGYLSTIPFLLIIFSILIKPKYVIEIIKWFTVSLIVFISLLLLIDAGLYQAWGVRLDTSLLPYLNTPQYQVARRGHAVDQ